MLSKNNLLKLLAVMVVLTLLISACDALEGIEPPVIEPPIEEPSPEGEEPTAVQPLPTEPATEEPTPTEMPPEPTPTEVPPEPTPTEVPPEPTPTEVPPEPTPTEVPPEPTPTEVPAEPTPTELPPEPTPTEVPAEPEPTEPPPPEPEATEAPPPEPEEPEEEGLSLGTLLLWGLILAVPLGIGVGVLAAFIARRRPEEEPAPELPSVPITTVAQEIKEGKITRIVVSGEELRITRIDGVKWASHKEPTSEITHLLTELGVTAEMLSQVVIEVEPTTSRDEEAAEVLVQPITTLAEEAREGKIFRIVVSGEELRITRMDGVELVSYKEPTGDLMEVLINLGVTPEMLSKIIIQVETPKS